MAENRALKKQMILEQDRLYRMYHAEKLSLTDIGKHYGCSRQYVQLVFKELGIKRRSQSLALKNRPKHRRSKYAFTDKDDGYIQQHFGHLTDSEIARKLDKPVKSIVYRRLIVLGKKKIDRRNFSDEEDRFIIENYQHKTDMEIARTLSRSLISVTHHRNRILQKPKRSIRSYSDDEDKFIIKNYKKMTDGEIAIALKRSKASVAIHRNEILGLAKNREI